MARWAWEALFTCVNGMHDISIASGLAMVSL